MKQVRCLFHLQQLETIELTYESNEFGPICKRVAQKPKSDLCIIKLEPQGNQ